MSEVIAKNMHQQQAALLGKSFISTDKNPISICYKWSVGSQVSYSCYFYSLWDFDFAVKKKKRWKHI